ncbi:hypothetical protein CYMTET_28725 [Cymbomonas tetramitiformis]|uniref:Nucleotide-diphospho-sugar transferase domain-containing protein n=1 Tax=Cymbomonas tetramitiformis TaxID=36881 RepID=A0AAE0FMF5_9CHLO|nr:hypothetical protein CYMTET_28725 [Cymbomonas tetramitiformis]
MTAFGAVVIKAWCCCVVALTLSFTALIRPTSADDLSNVPPSPPPPAPPPLKGNVLNTVAPILGQDCFPSTRFDRCPSSESTLYGSADLNATLLAAASCACTPDKTIVISVVNHGMQDVLDTQLKSLQYSAPSILGMWVVVALDESSLADCKRNWIHCVMDPVFSNEHAMETEHTFSSDAEGKYQYVRICWRRVEIVSLALRLGLNVIFTDIDIVWLKDPR